MQTTWKSKRELDMLASMRFPSALCLLLILSEPVTYAQTIADTAPNPSTPSALLTHSPLNGNWNITGNREKEQFPLLSLFLQVSGTEIHGSGDVEVRCTDDPRTGSGAKGMGLRGEVSADGSFTLRNASSRDSVQIEIRGNTPADGATTWNGEYSFTRMASPKCSAIHQTDSFTAAPLVPLNGTFSGSLTGRNLVGSSFSENSDSPVEATFSVTVKQGTVVSHVTKRGNAFFYLPLVGTVQVKGSSCFTHGYADPATDVKHGLPPTPQSKIEGDFVVLNFEMDDESKLVIRAVFTSPNESALSVFEAIVTGGECNKQGFHGTLVRETK